ncbi:MAG: hypothetical protein OXI87_04755 [Albidovulum sp.]|nr:hypothetical protein [Albidovulum sp.]MDE0533496.1 hypothetical protein [Albidovulum sp.]
MVGLLIGKPSARVAAADFARRLVLLVLFAPLGLDGTDFEARFADKRRPCAEVLNPAIPARVEVSSGTAGTDPPFMILKKPRAESVAAAFNALIDSSDTDATIEFNSPRGASF